MQHTIRHQTTGIALAIALFGVAVPVHAKTYYVEKKHSPVFRAPVHPYSPPVVVLPQQTSSVTTTTTTISQPYGGQWTQQTTTYSPTQPVSQCVSIVHGVQYVVPCNVTYQHPVTYPHQYGTPVGNYHHPHHQPRRPYDHPKHRPSHHGNHYIHYTPSVSLELPPFVFNVRL